LGGQGWRREYNLKGRSVLLVVVVCRWKKEERREEEGEEKIPHAAD
jgi:hypothetical protein